MAEKKETKKFATYIHRDNDYFLLSAYGRRLQFLKGKYTAKDAVEEKILADYALNTPDIRIEK